MENVLERAKFSPYLSAGVADEFVELVTTLGKPMMPRLPHPDFRDPKDRYLLAMLRDSDADALVTGDKALLALSSYNGKPVLTPGEFMRSLGGQMN